jgi:hypothetical protein
MEPLDILHKFLISKDFPWMDKVFLHEGGWSATANPSCIMAFKGEVGEKVEGSPLLSILSLPRPDSAVRVEFRLLMKWVSKFRSSLGVRNDVNTEAQGVIVGVNVDLRKLHFILKLLPPGDLFVWDTTLAHGVKSIGFERGPWRGCLAGVAMDASECTNIFVPEDKTPIDEMMDLESE